MLIPYAELCISALKRGRDFLFNIGIRKFVDCGYLPGQQDINAALTTIITEPHWSSNNSHALMPKGCSGAPFISYIQSTDGVIDCL